MPKVFNTTGICIPEKHYMVNIDKRLEEIKVLVDDENYLIINKARQYGKTTTLIALSRLLQKDNYVVFIDFQTFGEAEFRTENIFSISFADTFLRLFKKNTLLMTDKLKTAMDNLAQSVREKSDYFALKMLFEQLSELCDASDKKIILMIDEIDSATNNQVFIDFLAQLRAQYLKRFYQAAFKSVILAGVYDVKNLKQKIRPNIEHKYNSPWNIAADFDIDMSFSKEDIAGMLWEYEQDQQTGMNIKEIARMLYDYTSGYPFLVSRLCQLLDKHITRMPEYQTRNTAWTKSGLNEAVRMVLSEKNTLFESLIRNLHDYPQLNVILRALLFTGRTFSYSADESIIGIATMFGFIKNLNGNVAIANRLFETRLYNYYLAEDAMQETVLSKLQNPSASTIFS